MGCRELGQGRREGVKEGRKKKDGSGEGKGKKLWGRRTPAETHMYAHTRTHLLRCSPSSLRATDKTRLNPIPLQRHGEKG